ncbi:MAG: hypothetical protein J6T72_02470 [Alphaproteobacteria bacterium]|nr:hypothetical protein [Alphaproteobacteria bacterium]
MDYFEHKDPVFDYNGATVYEKNPTNTQQQTNILPKKKKEKPKKKKSYFTYWVDLISLFIIGFCLLGMDFTLYTSTGIGNIFSSFPILRPDIVVSLGIIAVITAIIYFCFSGFSILLCFLTGLVAHISFYALFNQFATFYSSTDLGYPPAYISASLAILLFAILFLCKAKYRFFLACLFLIGFGAILNWRNRELAPFSVEEYQTTTENTSNSKIVNIMLPNLPSYTTLYALEDANINKFYRDKLASIMLGFYAKYHFKLYTNSFTKSGNPYLNAADSLNMDLPENIHEHLLQKIKKTKSWNFDQQNYFELYLKDNKLFDVLKEKDYKINAYQNKGINFCKKENLNNVARCLTQNTHVADYSKYNLSPFEQSALLLSDWLESTHWLTYLAKPLYNSIKSIIPADNMPLLGTSYQNLHIINSLQALDKLFEDIKQDTGKNTYFIIMDMPSDMFLFDDMCRLKETGSWKTKDNFPWVGRKNVMEKRSAYLQQTMCLYGKLSQFMQNLQDNGLLKDTTVIIQGLIGMDDLHGEKDTSLLESFLNTQMTPIAIYSPENRLFSISKNFCSVTDIINQFFSGKKCTEFNGIGISKSTRNNVMQQINNVSYTSDNVQKAYREYIEWLRTWNQQNFQSLSNAEPAKSEDEIIRPKPQMIPLEEKNISNNKITVKNVTIAPEAKVESLSEMSKKDPVIEELPPEDSTENQQSSAVENNPEPLVTEKITAKEEAPKPAVVEETPASSDVKETPATAVVEETPAPAATKEAPEKEEEKLD